LRLSRLMGTPDQAVRQFHLGQDVLRRELDLAPQPETVSLYGEIIASPLSLQPSPAGRRDRDRVEAGRPPGAGAAGGRPFVGRDRVIQRTFDQLARRDEAKAGMIVVSGEAGVGKTRLLEEFADQAREQGTVTLCGGR